MHRLTSPSDFRELVSGRRRGARAALLRAALRLLEMPYAAAVRWRNRRYDTGRAGIHRAGVPVVSVGNLTVGGTGKTPMVEWLARWFRAKNIRVTIISRGYGAEGGSRNDEAMELEQRLPDVPHLQNPDRVAAAAVAVEELACEVIVLDDAFQHRRIARDLDIVLLDALEPFGFEHVLPRGTLREPVAGLRRAGVVVLSRAELVEAAQREAIRRRVAQFAPTATWAEVRHAPRELVSASGRHELLSTHSPLGLERQPVAAFCGIGNPAGFRHTLTDCGFQLAAFREFPDHRRYSRADVESLNDWAGRLEVAAVLCTQKDLVKLAIERLGGRPLWAVTIALEFLAGQPAVEQALLALLPRGTDAASDAR